MKRIRLILILIISLFLIGGCDETIDCGKNPDHESCIENIDCVKDPDHESCIDEVNYKEIELDASVLTKTLPEPSWWSPKSNFVGILQKYMTEKMSIPLLKFSEIDEFYIGLYIDKTFINGFYSICFISRCNFNIIIKTGGNNRPFFIDDKLL